MDAEAVGAGSEDEPAAALAAAQLPLRQTSSAAHAMPQAPQSCGSRARSTQRPSQALAPRAGSHLGASLDSPDGAGGAHAARPAAIIIHDRHRAIVPPLGGTLPPSDLTQPGREVPLA
jgi:hypothetical protein